MTASHAAETLHLRRFIEKQPACILRVGLDGVLLAVNEAALSLIGAEQLAQVLGTKLTRFIIPRQHDEWEEFSSRVREGASASIECDLTDMSGTRRIILLQGVPLLDHPDGVPSMILSVRDISAPRRLETALREREVSRELEDLQKQLEHGLAERQQLASSLTERDSAHQQLIADQEAEQARLRQTMIEQHELALVLKEQESQRLVDSLRTDLEQALAEGQRLAASLKEREAEHERTAAQHAADRAQLKQALAEEHQLALMLKEREGRQQFDGVRAELERSLAERQELTASLSEREASHQRVLAEHAAERERLERALAEHVAERETLQRALSDERQRLLAEERQRLLEKEEVQQRLESLRTDLEQTLAERQRLETSLAEQRQRLLQEQEGRQELEGLRTDLERALAERQRLEASMAEHAANHQRMVAEYVVDRAQLQRALTEEHQRVLQLKEHEGQQRLDALKTELDQALAGRQQLATLLDQREADHQRALSEHAAACALAEHELAAAMQKHADAEKALADLRVELQSVDDNARNIEWLAAAGRAAREIGRELQTIIAAVDARTRHLLAQSSLEADNRHVIEALRGDAIGAASLARQIVQAEGPATTSADMADDGVKG
jgi:PAS domain S-box-containing protein